MPLESSSDPRNETVCPASSAADQPESQKLSRVLEQRLQEQKLQAVGQLAGGIAHDFNNFLLLVSFCSEQLLSQISVGDERRKLVTAISDAASRAAGLTRQLLAFSQRQTMRLVPMDLNELIVRTDQIIRRVISHTISVSLRLTPTIAMVNIDTDQFEHVLLNLILNAQDAMPDGGRLTMETTVEEVSDDSHDPDIPLSVGRWIRFAVTDTGAGMTDEVRSRIFEPYFTTKAAGKGTGLGLAVVHGIINQLNGRISVQSSLGQGTTLEIWLPEAVGALSSPARSADNLPNRGASQTILLVEDETDLRQLLRTTLESQGYIVLEACHGPAAIAATVRHAMPIDLLITDVELPEMSGDAVAQVLRDDHPNLPTLFISGAGGPLADAHASDWFLQKPFKTSDLIRRVREILDSRTPFPGK